MKTVLIVLFVYFVFQMLRKAAQGQPPRHEVPNYNPSREEDAPLPGPWNRRAKPVESSPLPGPWDGNDEPLSGPWSRRQEQESTMETKPYDETDYQPKEEPVGVKRPLPEAPPREVVVEPLPQRQERKRDNTDGNAGQRKAPKSRTGEIGSVCAIDDQAAITPQPLRRRSARRRREHPLEAVLSCKTTLVGGLVLGEVLGNRGGRAARRGKLF